VTRVAADEKSSRYIVHAGPVRAQRSRARFDHIEPLLTGRLQLSRSIVRHRSRAVGKTRANRFIASS
jgi:hypothetical protein